MSESNNTSTPQCAEYLGYYEDGVVRLSARVDWPNGTPVSVRVASLGDQVLASDFGKVIIAGFGLAGRWIADIFDRHGVRYVLVEKNAQTVLTQRGLGRTVVQGDISDEETLRVAGIDEASILALTIPDEEAVLRATQLAREIKPGIYIVARTLHASAGLQATRLGADEVIKAEQVVARQFYEMLLRKLTCPNGEPGRPAKTP